MWTWCIGARSGSGIKEKEGTKNANVGSFPYGRGAHSERGGRFRFGVGRIYNAREFAGSSRKFLYRRGVRSAHGGRSCLGMVHILGLG